MDIKKLKERIIGGYEITYGEALALLESPLSELAGAADEIRKAVCGDGFDLCSVINGKCGKCGENCKFCAQSVHNNAAVAEFPLISDTDKILKDVKRAKDSGVMRISIVTGGTRLTKQELLTVCKHYNAISNESGISACASHGDLSADDFAALRAAGVLRYHCNLETSERFFPYVCTTHSYADKINTINRAKSAGLEICSGVIIGLGESTADRLDTAFALRGLGVSSVPVNVLNPIKGTPFEKNAPLPADEIRRVIALFRFILPDVALKMAAGRGELADKGRALFMSGANSCITGDMLTTSGVNIATDLKIIKELGYTLQTSDL